MNRPNIVGTVLPSYRDGENKDETQNRINNFAIELENLMKAHHINKVDICWAIRFDMLKNIDSQG